MQLWKGDPHRYRLNPALLASLAALATGPAAAATLQPEPDGTLVITALGEKIVVPKAFAAKVYVGNQDARSCREDEQTPAFERRFPATLENSLQRWLVDPTKAACFESLAPTDAAGRREGLALGFTSTRDGRLPYPGFSDLDFRQNQIIFDGLYVSIGQVWPSATETCRKLSENGDIDLNGYRRKARPDGLNVVFDRDGAPASPSRCVSCSKITAWMCSEALELPKDGLAFSVNWGQPEAESLLVWSDIDSALRRFASQISPFPHKSDLP